MRSLGAKVAGEGGSRNGPESRPRRSAAEAGKAVWDYLGRSTQSFSGEFDALLSALPDGLLDLSQQPPLSQRALDALIFQLRADISYPGCPIRTLILGAVDGIDTLCGHLPKLGVSRLDVSHLRVCVKGRDAVPSHALLSIRQQDQLLSAARQCKAGSSLQWIVMDRRSCLKAHLEQWQSLSTDPEGGKVQVEFVETLSAQEAETFCRDAFHELLRGGFEPKAVDALLDDPRFQDRRGLNLAELPEDQRPWEGLGLALASPSCPIRTLVLPPVAAIARLFGLESIWSTQDRIVKYVGAVFGKSPCLHTTAYLVELPGWTPAELKHLFDAMGLREGVRYLVSQVRLGTAGFQGLLACLREAPNARLKDLADLNESQRLAYQHLCWERLLYRGIDGELEPQFHRPELGNIRLELSDEQGFSCGYVSQRIWLRLSELLRHPACPLSELKFWQTELRYPYSAARKAFLSTFVDSGLRRLDLSAWSAADTRPREVLFCGSFMTSFGESDLKILDGLDVPARVPVIVLTRQQVKALRSQLEELSRKGWLFEYEGKYGRWKRVPKAPEPIDKRRLWARLEAKDDEEVRRLLFKAKSSPRRWEQIQAFARALSGLNPQGAGKAMPEDMFSVVSKFVAWGIKTDNERYLRDALRRDESYKLFSLDQCRALLWGSDQPVSLEQHRERQQTSNGQQNARRDTAFPAVSPPKPYEERAKGIWDALFGSWDAAAIRNGFADDPALSPWHRVRLNDWAHRTADLGRHLLRLLQEVERSAQPD